MSSPHGGAERAAEVTLTAVKLQCTSMRPPRPQHGASPVIGSPQAIITSQTELRFEKIKAQ